MNGQSLDNLQLSAGQSVEIEFSVGIPAESASQVSIELSVFNEVNSFKRQTEVLYHIFFVCVKIVMRIAKNEVTLDS